MSKIKYIIIGILIIVLLIGGIYLFKRTKEEGEKEKKVYRVGILCALPFFADIIDTFKQEMTDLGYIEEENIIYDVIMASSPVGNEEHFKKFVKDKVDLIIPIGTEASIEAKMVVEGTETPVVFALAFVEETNLIESIRVPGDNITGVRFPTKECAIGRLEILYKIAPHIKRVWVPYLKDYPTTQPQIRDMKERAEELRITITDMPFSTPLEVKEYLDSLSGLENIGMDGIVMIAEPFTLTPEVTDVVFKFAADHNLPIVSAFILPENYGPVASFYPTNPKFGVLTALQVDKVLKGTPAGTIPVLTADNDLRINYKYIQELGLEETEELKKLLEMAVEVRK